MSPPCLPWLLRSSPVARAIIENAERGDTVCLPPHQMGLGSPSERVAAAVRAAGGLVLVDVAFATLTTRERVDA